LDSHKITCNWKITRSSIHTIFPRILGCQDPTDLIKRTLINRFRIQILQGKSISSYLIRFLLDWPENLNVASCVRSLSTGIFPEFSNNRTSLYNSSKFTYDHRLHFCSVHRTLLIRSLKISLDQDTSPKSDIKHSLERSFNQESKKIYFDIRFSTQKSHFKSKHPVQLIMFE
jgi:hypothetical protein